VRGEADNGAFADGSIQNCASTVPARCVRVAWPFGWTANQQKVFQVAAWHGSLLEQKRDGSGLLFKRNRYLDPATGKFTQEDPIGLAGGAQSLRFREWRSRQLERSVRP
jgi:RHS repeat-associated protein